MAPLVVFRKLKQDGYVRELCTFDGRPLDNIVDVRRGY